MLHDPIEGSDYLFNRYAFLNVEATADAKTLEAAIRAKKAENHPDRYTHTSDEARRVAAKLWALTEKCEASLTEPETRAAFDARLAWFRTHRPELISDSGVAIISTKYTRISLDALVSDTVTENPLHKQLADSMAPFRPLQAKIMEEAYRADPTNREIRDAYRQILESGMLHYDLSQDPVWADAGVFIGEHERKKPRIYLEDFSDHVTQQIETIRDELATRVQEHYALLGSGMAAPLQLTDQSGGQATSGASQALTDPELVADRVREHFTQRTHRLSELAAKHQELVGKLLDTMEIWPISPDGVTGDVERTCLMREEEDGVMRCMASILLNTRTGGVEIEHEQSRGKTLDELKALFADAPTTAVETHSEVRDYLVYATFVRDKLQRDAGQER